MKLREVNEVIDCLSKDREVFFYYKNRYAEIILKEVLRYTNSIRVIKDSVYSKLLSIKHIKEAIAYCGNGRFESDDIYFDWSADCFPFTVTYTKWGCDKYQYQTSRRGFSLVVQLNFSNLHAEQYRKFYKPTESCVFNYWGHPVINNKTSDGIVKSARETLAWARIDLDFNRNEALIEEIQTDWLRLAKRELFRLQEINQSDNNSNSEISAYASEAKIENAIEYLSTVLKPYESIWAEAMLACSLNILFNEIGISKIFYHDHVSGRIIKDIPGRSPPRSLYTTLPRRFCFESSQFGPSFIEESRAFKKLRKAYSFLKWQELNISNLQFGENHEEIQQAA